MAATRRTMIVRLFKLMDKVIEQMESEMTSVGATEVDLLGRLVTSLGKLIEIDRNAGRYAAPQETREMLDIRDRLVLRIAELKRD